VDVCANDARTRIRDALWEVLARSRPPTSPLRRTRWNSRSTSTSTTKGTLKSPTNKNMTSNLGDRHSYRKTFQRSVGSLNEQAFLKTSRTTAMPISLICARTCATEYLGIYKWTDQARLARVHGAFCSTLRAEQPKQFRLQCRERFPRHSTQ
jgi:hypothetical protein